MLYALSIVFVFLTALLLGWNIERWSYCLSSKDVPPKMSVGISLSVTPSLAIIFSGYCLSIAFVFYSIIASLDVWGMNVWKDYSFYILLCILFNIVLLSISRVLMDIVVFPKISVIKSIVVDNNIALAIFQSAIYFSTAFMLSHAYVHAHSVNREFLLIETLIRCFTTFIVLQGAFIVVLFFYMMLFRGYNVKNKIKKGDIAPAIIIAGFLLGISLVTTSSIYILSPTFIGYITTFMVTLLLLVISMFFTDLVLMPKVCIKREVFVNNNASIAFIQATLFISLCFILYLV